MSGTRQSKLARGVEALRDALRARLTAEQYAGYLALDDEERQRFHELLATQELVESGRAAYALSFREFVDWVTGGKYKWYRMAAVIADVLQRVADGELKRVIINAPPRHGKSEPVSRLFPAYCLYRHPEWWVGLTSYGAALAHTFSRAARNYYGAFVGWLGKEARTVQRWETGGGGGVWALGAGGALLGQGFNVGIIDDPIKNAEQASSEKWRDAFWDWYTTTFSTRAEPNAAIVLAMQRWDEKDPVGLIFEQEWEAYEHWQAGGIDACEHWHVVLLAGLAEDPATVAAHEAEQGRAMIPPSCTVEPDWRKPGEALVPERYSAEELGRFARRFGQFYFSALFGQRPRQKSGALFKPDMLRIMDPVELAQRIRDVLAVVRFWDEASTADAGDYTAGTLMLKLRNREARGRLDDVDSYQYVMADLVHGRWEPSERDRIIRRTTRADAGLYGALYEVGYETEGGSSGKTATQGLKRMLDGATVQAVHPTGSKLVRATRPGGLVTVAGNGDFFMLRAGWNAVARRELLDFDGTPSTANKKDDIVDTAVGAYNHLARKRMARQPTPPSSSVSSYG